MKTILVVEDELQLSAIIKDYLEAADFKVVVAHDGQAALDIFESQAIDLAIIDIMLPKIDGWSVVRRLRKQSGIPVLVLTARAEEDDKLLGFELGADDYVTKPFSLKVLVARVKRLSERITQTDPNYHPLTYGVISIDTQGHGVKVNNQNVDLTNKEFELLLCFIENVGQVLSRDQVLNKVWGYDYYGDSRVVDTHVKKLRKKLTPLADQLKTVIKVGYKLEKNHD